MKASRLRNTVIAIALLVTGGTAFAQYNPQNFGINNAHDRAMQALERRDYGTAYSLFSEMARQGVPDGLFHLGMMHENGEGVPRDLKVAYARFYLAGKQGHATAAQYARDLQASMPTTEATAIRNKIDSQKFGLAKPPPARSRYPVAQPRVVKPYRPAVGTPPIRSER